MGDVLSVIPPVASVATQNSGKAMVLAGGA